MVTFRAAIWTAVSTERQAAPDRTSLKVQEDEAREKITSHGWEEVIGPFIVDGESRTKWASLYHAEKNIPALREMIDAAANGRFDILVLYDFNRFRSLLRQVFDVLCDYGVQMYTVKDGREPVRVYDDKAKSGMGTLIDVHMLMSNNQINNLSIYYEDGMSGRVLEQGLHPGTGPIPYGYRKPAGHEYDKKAVLEQTPDAQNLIKMKDLYLSGKSAAAVSRQMNADGIPTAWGKEWTQRSVAYVLKNPFYAGLVAWGQTRRQRIRRDGSFTITATAAKTARGKHEGLWDEFTYRRLMSEFIRRGHKKGDFTRALSGLLRCWCGEPVWVGAFYISRKSVPGDCMWSCKTRKYSHFREKNSTLILRFIEALQKAIEEAENAELPIVADPRPELEKRKKELLRKCERWITDYENEKINANDYTRRVQVLREEIEEIDKAIQDFQEDQNDMQYQFSILKTFSETIEFLPEYIVNADPAEVNTELHGAIDHVQVNEDQSLTVSLVSSR